MGKEKRGNERQLTVHERVKYELIDQIFRDVALSIWEKTCQQTKSTIMKTEEMKLALMANLTAALEKMKVEK